MDGHLSRFAFVSSGQTERATQLHIGHIGLRPTTGRAGTTPALLPPLVLVLAVLPGVHAGSFASSWSLDSDGGCGSQSVRQAYVVDARR